MFILVYYYILHFILFIGVKRDFKYDKEKKNVLNLKEDICLYKNVMKNV